MKLHTAIVSMPIQGQLSTSRACAKAKIIEHYPMTLKKHKPKIEKDLAREKI